MGKKHKPMPPTPPGPTHDLVKLISQQPASAPLRLTEGTYQGGMVAGINRLPAIFGGPGVVVTGGLKFYKCGPIVVESLALPDAPQYGLMVVQCGGLSAKSLIIHRAQRSGILSANTSDVLIDECLCTAAKEQHGIYLSQSGDRLSVQNCHLSDCAFSGIQVNAVEDHANPKASDHNQDSISKSVLIQNNVVERCQSAGKAAGIQCSGCYDLMVVNNGILDHQGKFLLAFWDDGSNNPLLACQKVTVTGNRGTFAGNAHPECVMNVGKNTKDLVESGNQFPAGLIVRRIV